MTDLDRLALRLMDLDPRERASIVQTLAEAARDLLNHRIVRHTCSEVHPDATCQACLVLAALNRVGV